VSGKFVQPVDYIAYVFSNIFPILTKRVQSVICFNVKACIAEKRDRRNNGDCDLKRIHSTSFNLYMGVRVKALLVLFFKNHSIQYKK